MLLLIGNFRQLTMRDYWAIWKQFVLQGVMQEDALLPAVAQAWRRCAASGLDPYMTPIVAYREDRNHSGELPAARSSLTPANEAALLSLVRPAMEDLHQFAEGSECVIVFADAEARILDIVGDQSMARALELVGLAVGASWSEERRGANALSLALLESFPIQLDGAMHYLASLHPFYTSAAPVHDLLGVIGRHEQAHPHTLGMVSAAAQAISNQLQMQAWLSNANDLLVEVKTILQTLSEGILLLRNDGVISQMNTPAGTMLGLSPAKVTGRRLSDVLPLPNVLAKALASNQDLTYEELVFDTIHGRVTCLCTLKPISDHSFETGLESIVGSAGLTITKPTSADGFVVILRSIERVQKLVHRMTGAIARLTLANVIGESASLKEALRVARLAANSYSTVLLHGETGTGKEIFAQGIHNSSARAGGPFVAVNCAAIPCELISTELFGYEGGAFTGADRQGRPGKFEQAHGGTLFLDEIGDMPLDLQTSLLRAIETRTIVRVGGQRVIPSDVRIIAATHKDLREEAQLGNFRSDLYYRLNVLSIEIPSLRERVGDMPLLVRHFLQRQSAILGRKLSISAEAMEALCRYNWPGNVRELENMLDRVSYLTPNTIINLNDLPPLIIGEADMCVGADLSRPGVGWRQNTTMTNDVSPHAAPGRDKSAPTHIPSNVQYSNLREHSENAEVQAIIEAWQTCNGNITRASALLGISRTTLWRKMAKYGLTKQTALP
jgi:transcriptional regulator of acetoin/glycerol metabolism